MRKVLAIFLSLAIAGVAAAQTQQKPTHPPSQRGTERIMEEVRHRLVMLPYYSVFDNLAFKVDDDTVTLLGQVVNGTLKSDAEAAVRDIEGVENVVNKIEILPASQFDDRIRLAIYRAIYGQPPLDRYALSNIPPIHIVVKNGRVSLEGVVDNESDKNIAGIRARTVSGVFDVKNNLQVLKH